MTNNRAMIKTSLVAAGFCVNARGGAYENGIAQPIQDKAAVAQKYFDLEENLLAGEQISVLSLADACAVSWKFAKKVVNEIENGQLIDPKTIVRGRKHSYGAMILSDGDCFYLLHLRNLKNRLILRDYAYRLAVDRGTIVSRSVICKWFRTAFPFKGSMRKLNKVPMDKFTDNNFLRWTG